VGRVRLARQAGRSLVGRAVVVEVPPGITAAPRGSGRGVATYETILEAQQEQVPRNPDLRSIL
jgi:hypothetical protein